MGYYLLDHRPPRSANWYTSRRSPLRVIVIHITAGLEDLDTIDDHSAEKTAQYAATVTDRKVSWHAGADADSYFWLLPDTYTAFHVQGYNSSTYGLEISKRHVKWTGMDPKWVEKTLWNAARAVVPVVLKYDIPRRLLSRAQVDAGQKGFTSHAFLDPARRSDPGTDFPWARFFQMIDHIIAQQAQKGFLMALSDEEQKELLEKTRAIHDMTFVLWMQRLRFVKKAATDAVELTNGFVKRWVQNPKHYENLKNGVITGGIAVWSDNDVDSIPRISGSDVPRAPSP